MNKKLLKMNSLILLINIHGLRRGRVAHKIGIVHKRSGAKSSLLDRSVLCQTGTAQILTGRELLISSLHTVFVSEIEKKNENADFERI